MSPSHRMESQEMPVRWTRPRLFPHHPCAPGGPASDLVQGPVVTGQAAPGLTLTPSMRKPRVDVELAASRHCM